MSALGPCGGSVKSQAHVLTAPLPGWVGELAWQQEEGQGFC